jgi:DNA repair protein RadC
LSHMKEQPQNLKKLSIKAWAEDDRPREKMMTKGRDALTSAELIAILIGSGTKDESAVDVAKRILDSVDNDLNKLGQLSIRDLMKFKGIGQARAVVISSALELGRRRKNFESAKSSKIETSDAAYKILYPYLADLDHEQFYALLLNKANKLIEVIRVSQGGVSATIADTRIILKLAIERLASSIIISHNHPSGALKPSQADIDLTNNLKAAAKIIDVKLLDHIIVTNDSYFSFADEGII